MADFLAKRPQLDTAAMAAKYSVYRRAIRMHAAKLRADGGGRKPAKSGHKEEGALPYFMKLQRALERNQRNDYFLACSKQNKSALADDYSLGATA